MTSLWIVDGNRRRPYPGKGGGPYDRIGPKKVCLHTTEGTSLRGAEKAFAKYPPHIGAEHRTKTVHQYVPLNLCSYSAKGHENDDEPMIQVEIVGKAREARRWDDDMLTWLVDEVLFPIWQQWPFELFGPPQGWRDEENKEAIWASADSPLRFSRAEFEQFSGILGHQHLPAPDNHWDPGAIDIDTILHKLKRRVGESQVSEETALERELLDLAAATGQRIDGLEARIAAIETRPATAIAPITSVVAAPEVIGLEVVADILQSNLSPYDLSRSMLIAVFNDGEPHQDDILAWMNQLEINPLLHIARQMIEMRDSPVV